MGEVSVLEILTFMVIIQFYLQYMADNRPEFFKLYKGVHAILEVLCVLWIITEVLLR